MVGECVGTQSSSSIVFLLHAVNADAAEYDEEEEEESRALSLSFISLLTYIA